MNLLYNAQLQIEISSNCNSKCLDCGRFVTGTDKVNPWVEVGSAGLMSLQTIKNIFDDNVVQNIKAVNFTGTYGDAITHPEFFEILKLISKKVKDNIAKRLANGLSDKLFFMMETNGGLHEKEWWMSLGTIINEQFDKGSHIVFGLDGIDTETHQKYRRGVDFNKVLSNAKANIEGGGRSIWSMLIFEHNEHQVKTAELLAIESGMKFRVRRSRMRHRKNENKELTVTSTKNDNLSQSSITQSKVNLVESNLKNSSEKEIICEWDEKKQISIDYTSRVWRCCYFSDFFHPRVSETNKGSPNDSIEKEKLDYYLDQYDREWNFCDEKTLSKILEHRFFNIDLPLSLKLKENPDFPLIKRCQKFCGKNTRSKDQQITENTK